MPKKYIVRLSEEERADLEKLISNGNHASWVSIFVKKTQAKTKITKTPKITNPKMCR